MCAHLIISMDDRVIPYSRINFGAFLVAQMVKNLSAMQETACNAGNPGSIPGSGRSPEEGNGNPLQYSCLKNPMERGAWQAIVLGVARVRHSD